MSEKASGVYLYITDNSIATGGASTLRVAVLMLTQKGKLGMNTVTANDFKEKLGYDLVYNPNYLGLTSLLESYSSVEVWRLNQGAHIGNAYISAGAWATAAGKTDPAQISALVAAETNSVGVSFANPGDAGKYKIAILPVLKSEVMANSLSLSISDVNETGTCTFKLKDASDADVVCSKNLVIYDALGESIIGIVKVASGSVSNKIFPVVDGIVGASEIGTYANNAGEVTITFSSLPSSEASITVKTTPHTVSEWELTYGEYDEATGVAVPLAKYQFSTDTEADNYYKKVNFGELVVSLKGSIFSLAAVLEEGSVLLSGDNGVREENISAADLDTTPLNLSESNIILANGFGVLSSASKAALNKIATKCHAKKKHLFIDIPNYTDFIDARAWMAGIFNSEYVACAGVDDLVAVSDDRDISVWPSINYGLIFSSMFGKHGNLFYPPAGLTEGSIVANKLRVTNFPDFANEMKEYRINWQKTSRKGSCMWEQRTTYSLNSDLSYIAPVFIVDGLSDELVSFEENYNFRYSNPMDLISQERGLNEILSWYKSNGFLFNYSLKVPSYAEAQAAGRTLDIYIGIWITKDSEVININLTLNR